PGAALADPAGADLMAAPALREPDVHILCDSAWATFHTRGGLRAHGSAMSGDWSGSAVLNYQGDGWRVRYLHAALAGAHAQAAEVTHHGGHGKSGSRHHGAAGADSKARKGHHAHPHKKP
ncbi:MAG: hypothetical protein KGI67_11640, partial [Pseudomonadota bacterium]|nr:hypothetical protein [Pseudomonadota bacterium]